MPHGFGSTKPPGAASRLEWRVLYEPEAPARDSASAASRLEWRVLYEPEAPARDSASAERPLACASGSYKPAQPLIRRLSVDAALAPVSPILNRVGQRRATLPIWVAGAESYDAPAWAPRCNPPGRRSAPPPATRRNPTSPILNRVGQRSATHRSVPPLLPGGLRSADPPYKTPVQNRDPYELRPTSSR